MKLITYLENSLMVGDDAAELLLEYARVLGKSGSADTVAVTAIDARGDAVTASFLLGPATMMMAETTQTAFLEPNNVTPVAYMRERIQIITNPPASHGVDQTAAASYFEDGYFDGDVR